MKNKLLKNEKKINFAGFTVSFTDFFVNQRILVKSVKPYTDQKNTNTNNSSSDNLMDDVILQDLLSRIKYKIAICVAKALNCTAVILNDCAVFAASDIMTNIIQGRKNIISFQSFHCKKTMEIQVLHPIHFIDVNAINYLYNFTQVNHRYLKRCSNHELGGLLQNLSEKFISKLNVISNTVTMLHELSRKLVNDSKTVSDNYCKLCYQSNSLLTTSSIMSAKHFSASISKIGNPSTLLNISEFEKEVFHNIYLLFHTYFDIITVNSCSSLSFKQHFTSYLCDPCSTNMIKCNKLICGIDVSHSFSEI